MVYIYKKKIGTKEYYYLRASTKVNGKLVTKDLAYLGNSIKEVKNKINKLPQFSKEIRKAYKTITKFKESNYFLEQSKKIKLKKNKFLLKEELEKIEACKLHWLKIFNKLDKLTKKEILKEFIIEFAFNTTSLEGNTITLKQAQTLLIEKITPKDKPLREIYDLQNTERAFFSLFENLNKEISHKLINKIHEMLMEKIDNRLGYRKEDIRVFKSKFKSTPAPYVKTDMNILLEWYKKNRKKLHPIVLGTIFHHKFEKIHPFMDGNGRTGRMLLNLILLKNNYPPLIIKKKHKKQYLNSLNHADKCNLTEVSSDNYKHLIGFSASELYSNYWNTFL